MSKRSDIRMYVEHLFMGRTLDAETIELKEEIYGNLVARFDDYIAQGLSEDEAYRRTCEAVTSVDDVLGEKNADAEKDGAAAGPDKAVTPAAGEKDAGGAYAETSTETVVMPAATEQLSETPPDPQEAADKPKKRWSKGKIAAVVAVAVVGVLLVVGIAQALVGGALFNRTSVSTTSSSVPVTDTTTTEGNGTGAQGQTTQTTQTESVTDPGVTAVPTGSGELWSEVSAHSCDDLAAYANTSLSDTAAIEALAGSLPLGSYVSSTAVDASARTATLTYTYPHDRDHLAHDDDHVDMALVYDAAAIMCTVPDLDTLVIDELEPDDGTYDRDRQVFERSTLEALLGVTLDESCLATDSWESLRNQLMTEHVYDRAWDLADHD